MKTTQIYLLHNVFRLKIMYDYFILDGWRGALSVQKYEKHLLLFSMKNICSHINIIS